VLFLIIYFFQFDATAYLELDFCSVILSENRIQTRGLSYEIMNFLGMTIMPLFSCRRCFY